MLNQESDLLPQKDILSFDPLLELFNLPDRLPELTLHSFTFERVGKDLRDEFEPLHDRLRKVSLFAHDSEGQQAKDRPFGNG